MQTTRRYSLDLISCAQMLAWKRKAEHAGVEDLRRSYTYFEDEKRIVQVLKKKQGSLDNLAWDDVEEGDLTVMVLLRMKDGKLVYYRRTTDKRVTVPKSLYPGKSSFIIYSRNWSLHC